jgi:alpha-aminoadipic semialdehyde synthase
MEVFERLPMAEVDPEDLLGLPEDRDRPRNVFHRTQFERRHRYRRRDGGAFDADELAEHPERYESALGRYLPHVTLLVHGAYWQPPQPPLVTREMLRKLFAGERQPKLRVVGDISCDIDGGIEATVRSTTPGDPVFVYDPESGEATPGVEGRGVVVMAVDNLPCELPVDASHHFGDSLVRFVGALARCDWRKPLEALELPQELRSAIVVHHGRLTPDYRYLEKPLADNA